MTFEPLFARLRPILHEQLPRLVAIAVADICHQTNPRPVSADDFERLFKAAM